MRFRRAIRVLLLLLLTVICITILCCIATTQSNLGHLTDLGVDIPLVDRIRATGHDLVSMGPFYGALIAAALAVAFSVAGLLTRWLRPWRSWLYVLAGALALCALLWSMKIAFGIHIFAVARSPLGFASQMLAGAAGGWLFARLTQPRQAR